ncbi:MAG: ADP-ribosylation factor-like protein [Candidatus Hermodarchaeota archaeon]
MAQQPVKLSVIGLSQAGKTSIVHRMKYNTFLQNPKMTIGILPEVVNIGGLCFVLWDVGGQTLRALWNLYRKGTKGRLYVIDAANPRRFIQNQNTLKRAAREAKQEDVPLAILANKVDIANSRLLEKLLATLELPEQAGKVKIFRTSAKTGVGIKEVMAWISEQISLQKAQQTDY